MDIVGAIIGPVLGIINKFIPDEDLRAKLSAEIQTAAMNGAFGNAIEQLKANTAEAASASLFVSGWRPAAGWICVIGLGYNTVVLAVIKSLLAIAVLCGLSLSTVHEVNSVLPQLDMVLLGSLLTQMLGAGALSIMRTVEKLNNCARNNLDN